MKKVLLFVLCLGVVGFMMAKSAMAATEAEKRAAIDAGLAYLATTQSSFTGAFGGGGIDYLVAQTGSAVLAFLEEKDNWGANAAAYQTAVDNGINYLLSNASVVSIFPQVGNPDGDSNGVGVKLYPGGTDSRDTYCTGIALPAIAASGTPNKVVTSGPLTGWTYKKVVQNVIDYFAFGQNPDGGWRYYANYGGSDQSTTQWPVVSALFASQMGVSMPGFVGTELDKWISAIQYADGAAGYTPTTRHGEMNETGALLLEQAYRGSGPGNPNVDAALSYINTHWQEGTDAWNIYDGNFGHPYAMWAIYKGLEMTIGLDDTTIITNLHADSGDVDNPDHGWNWWEDYCEHLVNSQYANGSWAGWSSWSSALATPWYINILAATEIPDNPPVPEPSTMILLAFGLVGMGMISRRKKVK